MNLFFSGLDDLSSSQCIALLKLLAKGGRTVICSIHTPSARLFNTFDNVYCVNNGQCVYHGFGPSVIPFLSNIGLYCPTTYNPSDFREYFVISKVLHFMDVVCIFSFFHSTLR